MPSCTNAHVASMQSIALAREAVASGTLSVATKYRMQKEWGIMKPVVKLVQDKSWYWVIEQDYDSQVVRETSQTNLNWVISHVTMWIILIALYWSEASVAKSSPNTSVYDHTFTVLESNNHPSLSIRATDPVWSYTTVYNMLNTLKISAKEWDYVKCDVQFVGKKITSASTPTVWYTTDYQFLARHCSLYIDTSEAGLDSATALWLDWFEINFAKNVVEKWIGLEPDCFLNQWFVCTGKIDSVYINNTDWLALTQWATEKFMRIKALNTDVTLWTSANPELSFTFAKVVFTEWDKSDDNASIVTQTVWFTAHFNNTVWFSSKAKLTNLQSATY